MAAAVPMSSGSHLAPEIWEKAINIFNTELSMDKKRIDLTSQPNTSFEEIRDLAEKEKQRFEKEKWRIGNITVRQKIESLLERINTYARVGDVLAQYSPQYASLAWGAFRFCLLVAANATKTTEKFTRAMTQIVGIFARAGAFAELYASRTSRLEHAISRLFAQILNLLVRARMFFAKSTLTQYWYAALQPFEVKFQPILDEIDEEERIIEKESSLLLHKDYQEDRARVPFILTNEATDAKLDDVMAKANRIYLAQEQEMKTSIYKWLNPLGGEDYHNTISCTPGTCDWIFHEEAYMRWKQDIQIPILWIRGSPGCGKTYLTHHIVEHVKPQIPIVYFYFDAKSGGEQQWAMTLLRSLIYQLLLDDDGLLPLIQDMFSRSGRQTLNSFYDFQALFRVFEAMCSRISTTLICVIDGADECRSPTRDRRLLFENMRTLSRSSNGRLKLLLTSRENDSDIENYFGQEKVVTITPADVTKDILLFVRNRVATTEAKHLCTAPLEAEIQDTILAHANGMFLWASLMMDDLEIQESPALVRESLARYPQQLEGFYANNLERICKAHPNLVALAKFIFGWLVDGFRPLTLLELEEARQIQRGQRRLNRDLRPFDLPRTVKRACGSLIRIHSNGTVNLSHFSVKEFLISQRSQGPAAFLERGPAIHKEIAMSCVTYLTLSDFSSDAKQMYDENLSITHPLSNYATAYWYSHLFRSSSISHEDFDELCTFLRGPQFRIWVILYHKLHSGSINHTYSFGQIRTIVAEIREWVQNQYLDSDQQLLEDLPESVVNAFAEDVDRTKMSLGEDHEQTVNAVLFFARIQADGGKGAQADALFKEALSAMTRVYGARDLQTLFASNEYARFLRDSGRRMEAAEIRTQILAEFETALGFEHPLTLRIAGGAAFDRTIRGSDSEGAELYRRLIIGSEKVFGRAHPNTLAPLTNFGWHLTSYGNWEEAETVLEHSLDRALQAFGKQHPYPATITYNIAWLRLCQQRFDDAQQLLREVLHIRSFILGPSHVETVIAKWSLALELALTDRRELAMSMFSVEEGPGWDGEFHAIFGISVFPSMEEPWIACRRMYEETLIMRARFLRTR